MLRSVLVEVLAILVMVRGWISRALSYVEYVFSYLRSPRQVVQAWPQGTIPLGPRVAIFIHFDGAGMVGPHVLHYVTALRDAGLSVVFVTNSGMLRPAAMEALQAICAGVIIRRNIGYDFGAMREGLDYLGLPRADTELVVLANDSIYGPLKPLDDLLAKFDFAQADLWGPTESWQSRYHIQSYFFAVGRTVLEHPAWHEFWNDVRPVKSKTWVVNNYELGLSQQLARAGLRLKSVWKYEELIHRVNPAWLMEIPENNPGLVSAEPLHRMRFVHAHRIRANAAARRPLNPTSDLWRQLLETGFPFLKRELLRDNPSQIADIAEWREVVERTMGPVPEMIERDLQKVMRNRAA
jgi:hypothetical protein